MSVNGQGDLMISLSDGTDYSVGPVAAIPGPPGADGQDGINGLSVTAGRVENDALVLTLSDASEITVTGTVRGDAGSDGIDGATGADGTAGADGSDGVGIATITVVDGDLVITLTDARTINLGPLPAGPVGATGPQGIPGVAGSDGQDGSVGPQGDPGQDGRSVTSGRIEGDALVLVLDDASEITVSGSVRGPAGTNGTNGTNGVAGSDGQDGSDGISITSASIDGNGDLVLGLSNGSTLLPGHVVGAQGIQGIPGSQGIQGIPGPAGNDGSDGQDGGIGPAGPAGADGTDGIGVASAALSSGNLILTLTDASTINVGSVVGPAGPAGAAGSDGSDGAAGSNGSDGQDGVGISSAALSSGNLILTLTDASTINVGSVIGPAGPQGLQGPAGSDGSDGSDGSIGPAGPAGSDGAPGVGVPTGGTAGQILSKLDTNTDYSTAWIDAPTGGGGGMAELVSDTSPQLGGDLDVNGKKITSTGTITVEPNGTLRVRGELGGTDYLDPFVPHVANVTIDNYSNGDFTTPMLAFRQHAGTKDAPLGNNKARPLGLLSFQHYDGTSYKQAGAISYHKDNNAVGGLGGFLGFTASNYAGQIGQSLRVYKERVEAQFSLYAKDLQIGDPYRNFMDIRRCFALTTTATPAVMNDPLVIGNEARGYEISVVARETSGSAASAMWTFSGMVDTNGQPDYVTGNGFPLARLITPPLKTVVAKSVAAWDVNVSVSQNTLRLTVQGAASQNITWIAIVQSVSAGTW
jgi:hypothetical protein